MNMYVKLTCGNKLPEDVQSIPQLRWYLFSKYQYESEKLPPTPSAFKYKVFRSHFFTLVLRHSLVTLQNFTFEFQLYLFHF